MSDGRKNRWGVRRPEATEVVRDDAPAERPTGMIQRPDELAEDQEVDPVSVPSEARTDMLKPDMDTGEDELPDWYEPARNIPRQFAARRPQSGLDLERTQPRANSAPPPRMSSIPPPTIDHSVVLAWWQQPLSIVLMIVLFALVSAMLGRITAPVPVVEIAPQEIAILPTPDPLPNGPPVEIKVPLGERITLSLLTTPTAEQVRKASTIIVVGVMKTEKVDGKDMPKLADPGPMPSERRRIPKERTPRNPCKELRDTPMKLCCDRHTAGLPNEFEQVDACIASPDTWYPKGEK